MSQTTIYVSSEDLQRTTQPDINPSNFIVEFNPPLNLGSLNYEVALYNHTSWAVFHNISSKTLAYTFNAAPQVFTIPDGNYSVEELDLIFQASQVAVVGAAGITLTPNYQRNVVQVAIDNTTGTFTLDLTAANNLSEFLGFAEVVISASSVSTTNPNVTGFSEILLNCSLVRPSYRNGLNSQIIYSFVPAFDSGSLMSITPVHLRWQQVNTSNIASIKFSITDNLGREIDFRGEDVTFTLLIREIS